jgi:hypothetical protein
VCANAGLTPDERHRDLLNAFLPFDAIQIQLELKVGFQRLNRTYRGDILGAELETAEAAAL